MKVLLAVIALFALLTVVSQQNAAAQLDGNRAYSLMGDGFSISDRTVSDSTVELIFTTGPKKPTLDLDLSSSILSVDGTSIMISDFNGRALRDGQIIIINSKAVGQDGKEYAFKAVGRLVAKSTTDAVYTVTGTLADTQKATRLIYTTMVSEFTITPTQTAKSDVVVKILKGSANPNERTYVEQKAGFAFKFLSEDRLTIPPGTTVTFVNEDTQVHSLESGTATSASRKKIFTPDGKMSSGDILPGRSWSVTFTEEGFYRLFDKNYQWIDATVFVIDSSKVATTKKPLN
ncbi:MAG: hypothetical protein QXG67_01870 [Candidatus Nitrosotenuis sp.]